MRYRLLVALAVASTLVAAPARAQQVWIVDAGGQGDFLDVQGAVDAAQDGDTILIHPHPTGGAYSSFVIQGKGLHVSGVPGAIVRTRDVHVHGVPAHAAVDLTRLHIAPQSTGTTPALSVLACRGAVKLTRCTVKAPTSSPGLLAEGADNLTLIDCEIEGSDSTALDVLASSLAVYGGSLRGGMGFSHSWSYAGDGHPGVLMRASSGLFQEVSIRGGHGGETCNGYAGDGGDGARLELGSVAYAVDTWPTGGLGGYGGCEFFCSACINGTPGLGVSVEQGSSWTSFSVPPRRMESPVHVDQGQSITLRFRGAPGDRVHLARSDHASFLLPPNTPGVLHLPGESGIPGAFLGVLPAHGLLEVELPIQGLPSGAQARRWQTQMIVIDAGGERVLASPSLLEVLDPALALPCSDAIHVMAGAAPGGDGKSWQTAFADLQDALAQAEEKRSLCTAGQVEIWVAQGTYTPAPPGGSREARFNVLSGLSLLGGFAGTETSASERDPAAHPTFLSGDLLGDDTPGFGNRSDNSYTVVRLFNSSAGRAALIDGFTVRGGHSVGSSSSFHRNGGGIYAGAGAIVRRCRIEDNYALEQGGGLYSGGGTQKWIVDCDLVGNRAGQGGGGAYATISAHFLNCLFAENDVESPTGTGGGLLAESVTSSAVVSIANCVFSANRADTGSAARIHLAFNSSASNVYPVSNTTIVDNEATGEGGSALWVSEGRTMVRNSILWGNTSQGARGQAAQLSALFPAEVVAHYTCIEGLMDALGPGNIASDPLLDAGLELLPGSPCIDAGNNQLVPADAFDLDGDLNVTEPVPFDRLWRPRFVDDPAVPDTGVGDPPIVDMGAHERQVPR